MIVQIIPDSHISNLSGSVKDTINICVDWGCPHPVWSTSSIKIIAQIMQSLNRNILWMDETGAFVNYALVGN